MDSYILDAYLSFLMDVREEETGKREAMGVCMSVYLCMFERESKRERGREREVERER